MTASLEHERCYRAVAEPRRPLRRLVLRRRAHHRHLLPALLPGPHPAGRATSASSPPPAAAQGAGFRACMRCRPDAVPGSPEWDVRADVVARAMRLIADGVVERYGVPGLAARLGYTERQLHRLLVGRARASAPLALARAQRAQTARVLIETTDAADRRRRLRGRLRQHPPVQRHGPRGVRADAHRAAAAGAGAAEAGAPGWLTLRLAARAAVRRRRGAAVPRRARGARASRSGTGRRSPACSTCRTAPPSCSSPRAGDGAAVTARLRLTELRDLGAAVARCRRMLDLDADPVAVDDVARRRPGAGRRWSPPRPAGGCRAPPTPTSSRCARCSASRCRWPARAR